MMIKKTYDKVTIEEVRASISSHAFLNHLNISKADIRERFHKGRIKNEKGYTGDNVMTHIVSWWNSEKVMLLYITAALNNENNKLSIQKWLKNWSKEDSRTYELVCITAIHLGKFAYKYNDWNKEFDASKFKIILQLECANNIENAGFLIKTAFPVPTNDELEYAKRY